MSYERIIAFIAFLTLFGFIIILCVYIESQNKTIFKLQKKIIEIESYSQADSIINSMRRHSIFDDSFYFDDWNGAR